MESYIVRIYRRHVTEPDRVVGMVESVEQETRRPFHSLRQLERLLTGVEAAIVEEGGGEPGRLAPAQWLENVD